MSFNRCLEEAKIKVQKLPKREKSNKRSKLRNSINHSIKFNLNLFQIYHNFTAFIFKITLR